MPCFNVYLTYYVLKHSQQFNYTLSLALAKTVFNHCHTQYNLIFSIKSCCLCSHFSDSVVVSVESYLTASITL